MCLDKEKYLDLHSYRLEVGAKGAANQLAAFKALQAAQQDHIDFWTAQLNQSATKEEARQEAWETRKRENLERHKAVLAERDARINAVAVTGLAASPEPVVEKTDADGGAKLASLMSAKADLDRQFEVSADGLQALPDQPGAVLLEQLASLWHFYALVGFGHTPALTFDALIGAPGVIHTILGDAVWEGFWGEKADKVARTDYVPMSMHKVLQYVVQQASATLYKELAAMPGKEAARVKYDAAKSQTATMMLGYAPF
jgi:hypothetical protein